VKIITSPSSIAGARHPKLFLGGSIEQDTAQHWQDEVIQHLQNLNEVPLEKFQGTIFNPRRDSWDSSLEQNVENDQFFEQVQWELMAIKESDLVAFYFDPNTKSPVTLMELGLCIGERKNVVVCCPEGFWRKGNVDILCQRYGVTQVYDLWEFKHILCDIKFWRK